MTKIHYGVKTSKKVGPKMGKIQYGLKTSRKKGSPKMSKIQDGVKPDIFKYADCAFWSLYFSPSSTTSVVAFLRLTRLLLRLSQCFWLLSDLGGRPVDAFASAICSAPVWM